MDCMLGMPLSTSLTDLQGYKGLADGEFTFADNLFAQSPKACPGLKPNTIAHVASANIVPYESYSI